EWGDDGATTEELAHLARCRACASAYADIVATRAGQLAGKVEPGAAAWVGAGRGLGSQRGVASATVAAAAPRSGGSGIAVGVSLAAAAALALVIWSERRNPVPDDIQRVVRKAMQENSYGSLLFAEDLLPESTTVRGADYPDLKGALKDLTEQQLKDPDSPE